MDLKIFTSTIAQIAEEKGISSKKVIETIETALAAAYKKEYGERGQIIKSKLNSKTGKAEFWQVKMVVDEKMIYSDEELEGLKEKRTKGEELEEEKKIRFNPERHIMLKEAKKIKPDIKLEEELKIPLKPKEDYGRIAAQTAKQVILQKIREAEREAILDEYKSKEGEVISGVVQRIEGNNVFLNIGKTLGILPREEQIPREFYKPGQRLKVYILKIEETSRGPIIFLSRAFPKLISKLFELEVPEISAGQVEIRAIAREPGSRAKIAVASTEEGVDPIGAAVGQKGTRVLVITNELGGEKIDIIEWEEEPEKFIANALAPANVLEVKIGEKNKALVIVQEDQLSLAIGKDGQNVRLAAKLTGWKIDVRSPEFKEKEEEAASEGGEPSPRGEAGRPEDSGREEKEKKPKKKKQTKKESKKKEKK